MVQLVFGSGKFDDDDNTRARTHKQVLVFVQLVFALTSSTALDCKPIITQHGVPDDHHPNHHHPPTDR